MGDFWVNGIVSKRDQQPYVQLSNEKGMIAQLTMAQARQIAQDILVMSSRAEADAMILKFFSKMELPENAAAHLLTEFRDFRADLDDEKLDHMTDRSQFNCIHCGLAPREHSPDGRCMTPDGGTSYEPPTAPPSL